MLEFWYSNCVPAGEENKHESQAAYLGQGKDAGVAHPGVLQHQLLQGAGRRAGGRVICGCELTAISWRLR